MGKKTDSEGHSQLIHKLQEQKIKIELKNILRCHFVYALPKFFTVSSSSWKGFVKLVIKTFHDGDSFRSSMSFLSKFSQSFLHEL